MRIITPHKMRWTSSGCGAQGDTGRRRGACKAGRVRIGPGAALPTQEASSKFRDEVPHRSPASSWFCSIGLMSAPDALAKALGVR